MVYINQIHFTSGPASKRWILLETLTYQHYVRGKTSVTISEFQDFAYKIKVTFHG